jgi:hypothetical protein
MATVGYYDMSLGQGGSYQVNELTGNGHTAVNITVPNATQLANIDTLYVTNPDNGGFGSEYLANRPAIAAAVQNGMNLVIFDRAVSGANTILPGGSTITVVRNVTTGATDINLASGAPAAFTAGLNNSSFDGGNLSSHGYVTLASLPPGAVPLLTRANGSQVVAFTYPYGSGTVFYSTIPLDFYSSTTTSSITPAEVLALLNNTINVLCFAAGTRIETTAGSRAVEDLRPGDMVRVLDGSYARLRWVGQTRLDAAALATAPHLAPVVIAPGALGQGLPRRALRVSRQHRMLIASGPARNLTGQGAVLVAACKLVGLPGITQDSDAREVVWFHLLFDRHQVIWAEGAPSESLLMGEMARQFLTRSQQAEITAVCPAGATTTPALPVVAGAVCKELIARHRQSGRALLELLPAPAASAQGVARPAHSAQRIAAPAGHQRLAQPSHMNIHRPAVDVNVAAPDPVQQLFTREHPARAFHQAR